MEIWYHFNFSTGKERTKMVGNMTLIVELRFVAILSQKRERERERERERFLVVNLSLLFLCLC